MQDKSRKKLEFFKFDLLENATLVGDLELPQVYTSADDLPRRVIPFSEASVVSVEERKNVWLHFFIDDYRFERVWNRPRKYLPFFKSFGGIIGFNFSMFSNMPKATQIWNLYRNNVLCHYFAQNGVNVIPTVNVAGQDSIRQFVATIAPESIVAVSALGASKDVFVKMVKYIMQAINPPAVLYFGRKFKELKEFEDKLIYFGTFDDKFDTSNKKEI